MAKILLNVELESKTFQAQLQKIKEQLDQTFSGAGGVGGGVGGGIKAAKAQVESLQKSFANLLNTLKGSESKYAPDTFKNLKTQITNALNATKALNKEIGDGKPTDEQKKRFAGLNKQLSALSSSFATARVESEKLQKENKLAIPNVDNLRKKYANLLNTIQGTEKYYKKGTFSSLTDEIKNNLTSLQKLDPTTADYAVRVNELDKQLNKLSAQFAETKASSENMHGSFLEIVKGFAKFQLSAMLVMKPLQMIRDAWADLNETLVETEDSVIALRRVAGDAANANELYDLAQRYGQTFENVSELATNFSRAGYEWNETIKATEAALLALNTAELDATEASDGMIAILQQFGYEASELESIIDKLNITADNAAVSTDGLLKALSRTGSSAKNAKLSLEETVAVVTALSEATGRSGENIGTALNSLIQFSTKASALDTFAKLGGDVEKTVELYRQGGATVLDIWEELSKVISNSQTAESILGENFTTEEFEALNEELKQALGENFAQTTEIYDTASTFRKNYFIALLQNLDQVQESLDTMQDAQGYSQKENAQYLDTYTAKVNDLQAKWQEIANDEQGLLKMKKTLVETGIVALDILDTIGGISTVVNGLVAGLVSGNIVIGIVAAAISGIISAIQDYNETQEQERKLAISTWEAEKEKAETLQDLYDKYTKLNNLSTKTEEQEKELESVEKSIVTVLGEKYSILNDLTQGTVEYKEAVKNLTKAELEYYNIKLINAQNAAKEELETTNIAGYKSSTGWNKSYFHLGQNSPVKSLLGEKGFEFDKQNIESVTMPDGRTIRRSRDKSVEGQLNNYEMLSYAISVLYEEYQKQLTEGNVEEANQIIESEAFKSLTSGRTAAEEIISNYFGTSVDKYLSEYQKEITNEASYNEMVSYIIKSIGAGEFYNETIKNLIPPLTEYIDVQKEATNTTTDLKDTIEELAEDDIDDLVKQFEKLRDAEEDSVALEEAKAKILDAQNDLIEKQQALQEAKNSRTIRVFNAETGQWEMQANQKEIDKAQEAVEKAEKNIEDAERAYEKQAYNSIIRLLESEDKSTFAMVELLATIASTMPQIKNKALSILSESGVNTGVYDSGGFLYGIGGIKATNAPETVLPPWLTEKIIEPSSNERFQSFTKSLGLLFGASDKMYRPTARDIISNVGGNTTNSNNNNNNTYSVNGVPITQSQAENYTIAELFEVSRQLS